MDAVILAAGRGTRMAHTAEPFHKPLVHAQGKPLIQHAVDAAYAVTDSVIVVAAPANSQSIRNVIGEQARIVIQQEPLGPSDALRCGLSAVTAPVVLVLMADNIFGDSDVAVTAAQPGNAICVTRVPARLASRLTWWDEHRKIWVEKVTPGDSWVDAWVGPLRWTADEVRAVLERDPGAGEHRLGPLLNHMTRPQRVHGTTRDIASAHDLVAG